MSNLLQTPAAGNRPESRTPATRTPMNGQSVTAERRRELQRVMTTTAATHSRLTRCRYCDGSRMVKLIPGRRHGTGRMGQVTSTIAGQEELTPERHCTCVGGPLWNRLETSNFGRECRLDQIGMSEYQKGRVVFWIPGNDEEPPGWMEMPAADWRAMLRVCWDEIAGGATLEEIAAQQ